MKAIISMVGILAFVFAAQAADMAQSETKSMESATPPDQGMSTTAPSDAPVTGTVAREAITTDVENHEPVDQLSSVTTDTSKVYFFTELRDMEGQTVTHRWEYNGKVMAEVPFEIGGPRWRVYSSKNLLPGWTGDWRVSVVASNGTTLDSDTFTYTPAPEPSAAPSEMSKEMSGGATEEPKSEMPSSQ